MNETPPYILLVEDQDDVGEAIEVNLRRHGLDVRRVRDGLDALHAVQQRVPDAMLLDLGLPRVDGMHVLRELRQRGIDCPVLILSARGAVDDKVEGFCLGADDYLTKPFHTRELTARLQALMRRVRPAPTEDVAPPPPDGVVGYADEELIARFGLTARQAAVARLMAHGLTNPEIAGALSISVFTARNHANSVLERLRVPSRGHVAAHLRAAYDAERAPGDATT